MKQRRTSSAYLKGLEEFLDFGFANASADGEIICPCNVCGNSIWVSRIDARGHLICNGFIKCYTKWVAHGEVTSSAAPPFSRAHVALNDISKKNKNNQKEKKLVQTTGKESYALVRERKNVELGHDPSWVEMFIECHSKKDENITPSTVEAANYMAQMNEKREKLPEGSQDVPSENDILAQVMGKNKYGRVRMYGLRVSQSDVWGRLPSCKQSHRIVLEWKANC
ncbi:hypothetical protein RJ639_018608 [Escallonia herrerae]|uniref:Transposase-associated domain-containing protein n=1 Tax=Escallonia herrerae TaxID=1293975 RepID=A0AA89AJ78_9ASTE|nr:hypothetical protein RJ639_018608 [Escallonia herrerae]